MDMDYGTHWLAQEGAPSAYEAPAAQQRPPDWGVATSAWTFIACRALDIGMTGYMLHHYPNISEANPIGFPAVTGLSVGLSIYLYRNIDDWNADPRNGLKLFDNAISCLPVLLNTRTLIQVHRQ